MKRASTFYEAVLGLKLEKLDAPIRSRDDGLPSQQEGYGAAGSLVRMAGMSPGGTSTIRVLRLRGLRRRGGRVAKAGGRIHQERCRSASTVSSSWRSTPKATWSACIQ